VSRIKIFHLIKSLNRGGAETLLSEGLKCADLERFEYTYGYFNPNIAALVPVLEGQGAVVKCFGAPTPVSIMRRVLAVARELRLQRADLLHCHLPLAGVVGRLAGRLAGVPVIYTEHNKPEWYRRPTFLLNSYTYRFQDHVIAVSQSVADSIHKYIRPTVPVTVIRNGIDAQAFQRDPVGAAAVQSRFGIPPDAVTVGNVAALIPQKRLQDWLAAARLIHERVPRTRFLLVGEGPEERELLEAIDSLGLRGVAHLCGVQEDVRPYLSAMDVYMMSSAYEGLPVALLEAMALDCAPVCTAVGGIPEVIIDGVNGFLTEAGFPEQLADRVVGLVSDPVRLRTMACAARSTLGAGFRVTDMIRAVETLYLAELGRQSGSIRTIEHVSGH
jgi:L-malate glycosyltransferase